MYIGNSATQQAFTPAVDYFSGNGSTTGFILSRPIAAVAQVQAVIENVLQNPSTAFTVSGNTITFTSAPPSGTNNIYVYYTSPITQIMQPGQGTVGDNQLGAITKIPFVAGSSLGAGNASIMKNRIINGAMVIDQRNAGASVTPAQYAYGIDRWQFFISTANKYTVQQNAGSITPPTGFSNYLGITSSSSYSVSSSDFFGVAQKIEGYNTSDLGWGTANAKTITLSFWVYSSLTGTFGGAIGNNQGSPRSYPFTYSIPVANTWTQISVTIPGDTTGTWIGATNGTGIQVIFGIGGGSSVSGTSGSWSSNSYLTSTGATSVVGTNGATFYITGVQLEVGSSATGFEYRQYGQELALCQRYCVAFDNRAGNAYYSFGIAIGQNGSTTTAFANMTFPVTMRTKPSSVTLSAANTFWLDPSNNNFTSVTLDQVSPQVGGLYFTGGTGGIGNAAGRFLSNGSAAAYAIWSAEL